MTPDRQQQVDDLYAAALEMDPGERSGFVVGRTEGDPELRREVQSLLEHASQAGDFLERSALDLMADVVGEDHRAMVGRVLGHYRIVSLIGRGGMGEVWKAEDTKLGREVAIKMLPGEFSSDRGRMARLEREAQVLASVNHPGIAAIYGFEEHDGIHCLVMEYVEGETLAQRLRRTAIPVVASLELAVQVAEALESAHEKGVVHRDLKPANIVVTADGRTKLLDFGLAKALEDPASTANLTQSRTPTVATGLSMDGAIVGTAAYMSPEQARGSGVDKRADVWALGCVLYELLAGRRAFEGESVSDVLASVLAREPDSEPLERYRPALRRLVERCLDKDPRQRIRDIGDVRIELMQLLALPPSSLVDTARPTLGPVVAGLVAATGLLLVLLGAGLGWILSPSTPSDNARFVVSAFPARPVRLSGLTTDVAISPDGGTVAYSVDVDGHRSLYIRPIDRLEGMLVAAAAVDTPFFSPDGDWIGFSSVTDGVLRRMPVTGGEPQPIADLPGAARGASWGPDDVIVVSTVDASTGLLEVSARGGVVSPLTIPAPGEDHLWPHVLPGGRQILFTIRSGLGTSNSSVAVYDRDKDQITVLVEGATSARYVESGYLVYAVEGRILAARFDPGRPALTGESALLFDGLVPIDSGAAPFDVAANGSLAYVSGDPLGNDRVLAFVERDGRITPLDLPRRPYLSPRLSPDQTRIAVQVDDDNGRSSIWVYDLDGESQLRELTQDGNSMRPVWTADSRQVTFASDRDGTWGIYSQVADGGSVAERLLSAADEKILWPESWSPDGRTLAYTEVDGEARGIWMLTVDGDRTATRLFYDAVGFHQNASAFAPGGDWLAYYSNESNIDNQIYVQPFPATGAKHRITLDGGVFPVWSPAGGELIYRRAGAAAIEGTRLYAVELGDGDIPAPQTEVELPIAGFTAIATYRDYDVTADGRFLMVYPEDYADAPGSPRRRVNLIMGWTDGLAERTP